MFFLSCCLSAQRVGLVLSGGGAGGLAHIGVIKALEEAEIPIDYITGTSMGALVGGLYASGYSVEDMVGFANSPEFLQAVVGELPANDFYYFSKEPEDATIIRFKFNFENFLQNTLPTSVVTPNLLDYLLMDLFAPASAAAAYDFDKLMLPFRCVAADVVNKKEVIFSEGNLAVALRASSTYPFYYRPLIINGSMLFDGGLYNNFPADVMYDAFLPDVIIGSNVASEYDLPHEDDLFSQVRSMIMSQSDFSLKCEDGLIISPEATTDVFNFSNVNEEIEKGYLAAKARVPELKEMVERALTAGELAVKRSAFRANFPDKKIGEIKIDGELSPRQREYVMSSLGPLEKGTLFEFNDFRSQFLRIAQDDKMRFVHPTATFDTVANNYSMRLYVRRERNLTAFFGGNFSSKPINMGYVGLKYDLFGRTSTSLFANSYFGRFYGSVMVKAKIDFGGKKRWRMEPHFVLNRWDYFRNFSTFFEQSRPSFIVKNEVYGGLTGIASFGNNAVVKGELRYGETLDRYYQTENFTIEDTSDVTNFKMGTAAIGLDRNTLNRRIYSSRGSRIRISARGIFGKEITDYGTTRPVLDSVFRKNHAWLDLRFNYENYFYRRGMVSLGFDLQAAYTNKPFFANYTASIISAPGYTPIPESSTLFLESFRAHVFAGFGLRTVVEFYKNLEFRLEGYAFQPGRSLDRADENQVVFSEFPGKAQYIGASALVFHSPIGPVSLNLNYYSSNIDSPWSFLFNFGFTIFNKSIYEL
jgi:NTE family protein